MTARERADFIVRFCMGEGSPEFKRRNVACDFREVFNEALAKVEEVIPPHDTCADCWYSCPLSAEGCCNDQQEKVCTCGRDNLIAAIRALREE